MEKLLGFLKTAKFGKWVAAILGVFVALTAVTALTPVTWDDAILNALISLLEAIPAEQAADVVTE